MNELSPSDRTDEDGEVYHFSSRNQRLSETVVQAVAWVMGVDPLDLDPLGDYIDPAALDVIFAETEDGFVSFDVEGLRVRVDASGGVEVINQRE